MESKQIKDLFASDISRRIEEVIKVDQSDEQIVHDELVEYVRLPQKYRDKDFLREYYGNVEWAVRSIFNGYMGWFDGNATNLFPLGPRQEAERVAKLAGGRAVLLERAREALAGGDAQWAAQLCDHLLALDPRASAPKLIKADAQLAADKAETDFRLREAELARAIAALTAAETRLQHPVRLRHLGRVGLEIGPGAAQITTGVITKPDRVG